MDRRDYWNKEYTEYWKKVTEEAQERGGGDSRIGKLSGHDFKTPDTEVIYGIFDKLDYKKEDKLLDYGCGFGRFYPYFSQKADYYGIDISQAMIDECVSRFPESAGRFEVAEGEDLHFSDGFFDKVICYGVFDACYQERALSEMFRICRMGGYLLVSGKADHYFADDEEAYVAEVNARKKGHPNYFTNVQSLLKQVREIADIQQVQFSLRRGDFTQNKFVLDMPGRFYEWVLILQKTRDGKPEFDKFSDIYSRTWYERKSS